MIYNLSNLKDYVKLKLGHPYNPIELSDDEIEDILKRRVILNFSKYFPVKETVILSDSNRINNKTYKVDKDLGNGKFIINVLNIVPSGVQNTLVDTTNMYDYTSSLIINSMNKNIITFTKKEQEDQFILTLSQNQSHLSNLVVHIECTHAFDLSTFTLNQIETLEIMALSEISQVLIGIRSMYQTMSTNVGEINLNIDFLKENIEAFERIKDDLKKAAIFSKRVPLYIA